MGPAPFDLVQQTLTWGRLSFRKSRASERLRLKSRRQDGRLWFAGAVALMVSVVGSVVAIRSSPDPSWIARWAAVGGVVAGISAVLVARPPFPGRWRRQASLLLIGVLAASAYTVGKVEIWPQRGALDPGRMEPVSLSLNVQGGPNPSQLFRIDVYAPPDRNTGGSRLRLLEDGEALGPPGTPTSEIAQWGLGAYRHRGGVLSFSTSDTSDPRTNGRVYEFLRYPAVPGAVLLVLIGGLALALRQRLRAPDSLRRPVLGAAAVAAVSVFALNVFHIDDAPLNIKDARQNLEMAQAIATTPEARDLDWLLSQRREPLPNLVLAAQMRLDPRLDGIIRGESVQAPEFQVALKQNTLLYVALLYLFALLAIRRMLPPTRRWFTAFVLFVVLTHLLFLQFHEYINRNYTEVHAAAFLVMAGYFLLRYSDTRSLRDALLAIGALVALTLTKGLFVIALAFTLLALIGDRLGRRIRVQSDRHRRMALVAVLAVAVLMASGFGGLVAWGARLSQMPADPDIASSGPGFAMSTALPGRVAIPVRRSFWNVRDVETLQRRLARNVPSIVRPERFSYDRGYEVGSARLPLPAIWEEPRFASRREAQAAAVAVVAYNHARAPIATAATALSLASLLTVAPRTADLTYDQRDALRVLVVTIFVGIVLRALWRRDPRLWFYLPTLFGMLSYSLLAHGRYRYWAPFVPTTIIAAAVGLIVLGVAVERWARWLPRTREIQRFGRFAEASRHRTVGLDG